MQRGILYIANGDFIQEAIESAKQVRTHMQNLSISVVTDQQIGTAPFDSIIPCDDPSYGWRDKLDYIDHSPYDQTIYLDTDTYLTADISSIFGFSRSSAKNA